MATSAEITGLYQELLGRAPDAGGLQHYAGYNPNFIRSDIMKNSEYIGRQAPATLAPKSAQQIYDEQVATDKAARDALISRQNTEQQGLFTQYSNKIGGQEALPALYSRLQGEAGIPGLSQAAQGYKDEIYKVKDRLDRLGEDVTARTTGYNVSDAQRRRLETAEADPLQTNLGRLGNGLAPIAEMLSSAQSGVQNQLGLYEAQQQKELKPLEMQINSLSDRFAREITGFQQGHEDTLTNLLNKLQREQQLSDRDWELAQTLAAEERAYSRQKASAASQLSSYTTASTPTTPSAPTYNYSDWSGGGVTSAAPSNFSYQASVNSGGLSSLGSGPSISSGLPGLGSNPYPTSVPQSAILSRIRNGF